MCFIRKLIFISVLVQIHLLPILRTVKSAYHSCDHPWKEDFGLNISGSIRHSLESFPQIYKGFLDKTQDLNGNGLKLTLDRCIKNPDCIQYVLLDKKRKNSMTMCVVVNGAKACYSFNCSCPNKRDRRTINTSEVKKKNTPKLGIIEVNCKFKIIHNESIFNIIQRNFTNSENDSLENPIEYTASLKEKDTRGKEGNNTWLYFLMFGIGVGIGTACGGIATYLWFKRKYLQQKNLSVVNGTYDSERASKFINETTEYSEIPECSDKTYSAQVEDFQHQTSFRNVSHSKFRASPSLVAHVDMCEHSFHSEGQKKEEHIHDMEQRNKLDLFFSDNSEKMDGIANNEANFDIREEKEVYNNDVNSPVQDEYLVPLKKKDIAKNQEDIIERHYGVDKMNHSCKEDNQKMTHTAHEDNIISNSVYFQLSDVSENEKRLVPECTNIVCKDQCKMADRSQVKTIQVERAAFECEDGDDQPTKNVYFELSKASY